VSSRSGEAGVLRTKLYPYALLYFTSRTSPLQGHLAVLKLTVCHTAGHYGEEYDD